MGKLVLGIDESGRGPVVGDMVIVGAMFDKDDEEKLKRIGVKDSKLLSAKRREELYPHILNIAKKIKVVSIPPQEIDQRFAVNSNLNNMEAVKFAEIVNELRPEIAIIDTPSANTENFKRYLSQFLDHFPVLNCENYADKNHVSVSAASIVAKVLRDSKIRDIEIEVGMPIGIGYPSDPVTLGFVEKALDNKEWLKKYIRKSWLTFQRIKEEKEQKRLGDF